jgi:hypothetical protein
MPSSAADPSSSLHARVAVLSAMIGTFVGLLGVGLDLARAATIAAVATAGGVEIGCRLTAPYPAPKVRVTVLVIILVVVVHLIGRGYLPAPILAVVLVTASVATEIARRLTGLPYPLPKPTY